MNMFKSLIRFDPETYTGRIPAGHDIVVYDRKEGISSAMVLNGFDEIGTYEDGFQEPAYAFYKSH